MNKLKRFIAILMASTMIVGLLAGCSKGANKNKDAGTTEGDTPPGTTAKAPGELVEIKLFADFLNVEQTEFTKEFIALMEKENNVKMEFEVPPAANYNERLQLMLVSGIYPDAVLFTSHTNKAFLDGVNSGIFIPVEKYVKDAPNLMKYTYPESWDVTKVKQNDEIYMIPRTSIARNDGYIVREDWLENVGITLPDDYILTIDEFTEILKRFTENDPDKNGKKDTFGYIPSLPSSDGSVVPFLYKSFGILGWQEYNEGNYKYMHPQYSRKMNNYKECLEYSAMLWKNGYLHPDYPLMKGNAINEAMDAGQIGMTGGFAGNVYSRQTQVQVKNPEARLTYISGVKDKSGKVNGGSSVPGIYGGWAITNSSKHPDRVVQVFDWCLGDFAWEMTKHGVEGKSYTVVNGKKVATDNYEDYKKGQWAGFVRRNDDASFFIGLSVPEDKRIRMEKWIDYAIKTNVFSKDYGYKPPISNDAKFIEAQKRLGKEVNKIIFGDQPASSYDKALDDWYKSGGETFIKEMNDYIKSRDGK